MTKESVQRIITYKFLCLCVSGMEGRRGRGAFHLPQRRLPLFCNEEHSTSSSWEDQPKGEIYS